MILEKVYDELYGMIEDLKKKVAGISGGSVVTITPALDSGTKIADYEIDETEGTLYAPTPFIPIDYSENEQDTGIKWIDGKPLYQKTVYREEVISGTQADISLGIENVENIMLSNGSYFHTDSTTAMFSFPYIPTSIDYAVGGYFNITAADTSLSVRVGSGYSGKVQKLAITVLYTKTTDTPHNTRKTTKKK